MNIIIAVLVLLLGGCLLYWLSTIGVGLGIISVAFFGLLFLVGKIAASD
jgi:hypothetical protein